MTSWYLVYTHSGREELAMMNLHRQGFQTYLPQIMKKRRHARRVEQIRSPLFPRYLFVALNKMTSRWRSIQSTIGVSHLVSFGDCPIKVPECVVEDLLEKEDENGLLVFVPVDIIAPGDKVRILEGAFEERVGILDCLDDNDRVNLLLELMGRQVKIKTALHSIAPVGL